MFELKHHTGQDWVDAVMADFPHFLQDHAAAEKKASGMAMAMLSHYPDKAKLVRAMTDLAIEELIHFKQVLKLLVARDVTLGQDKKDPYITQIRALFRNGTSLFLLDRLLVAAVIEGPKKAVPGAAQLVRNKKIDKKIKFLNTLITDPII